MSFFRNLTERVRERVDAPALQTQVSPKINFVDRFAPAMDRLVEMGKDSELKGYDANLDKFVNLRNMNLLKSKPSKPIIGQTARRDDVKGLNLSIGDIDPITGTIFTGFPKPPPPPVPTQMSGIGSMLPTQTITLPNGQTVQIPEINMEELNANLLAAGITPQTPLPNIVPEVATPTSSLPVATPSLPVAAPITTGYNDGNNAVTGDFNPYERVTGATNPVYTPTPSPVTTPTPAPQFRTADFQDFDGNGIDDRDEPVTIPAVEQPLAPYTGSNEPDPNYIPSLMRQETGLDALTQQLLFGLDGEGGFIPGAMRAAERTFFNPDGTPRVVEERRADLTADQLAGLDLARRNVGIQDPFLTGAERAYRQGVTDIGQGIERGRGFQQRGLQELQSGIGGLRGELGGVEGIARRAAGNFGTQLGGIARRGIGATGRFGRRLGESENLLRGTTGAYDQGLTSQFYNPFEERVVQQTIDDVLEAGDKQDMAQRARDIQSGGESAFGSRARLGASERREALGRGLGEALGGIRSRGFSEAQQTGLGEFARQRQAERLASSGLAGLSGQRLGAQQALGSQLSGLAGAQLGAQQNLGSTLSGLAGTRFGAAQTGAGALSNMGALETQYGQTLADAQFGLGGNLQNLGSARQQAGAFDVNQLLSSGGMQQAQNQAVIDAQRANQLTAQAAPLAQYQALSPFIQMVPKGSFQTSTQFAPRPSPMMAGINVGLGALGALGNMANQPRTG